MALDDIIKELTANIDALLKRKTSPRKVILSVSELREWLKDEPTFLRQVAHPTELMRKNSDEDLTEPCVVMFKKGEPVIASLVSSGSSYNHNPTSTARIYASALRDPYQRTGENSSLLRATFQLENCQGPDGTNGLLAHISQGRR